MTPNVLMVLRVLLSPALRCVNRLTSAIEVALGQARPPRETPARSMAIAPDRKALSKHIASRHRVFHKYLDERYADTVVLTFAQIEDLLGGTLPASARADPGWWTGAQDQNAELQCSDAWRLAHRTAVPNLPAGHVSFERVA